jgi:nucleotide-binding universal stress UspA family protein
MYEKLLICVTGAANSLEVAKVGLSVASRNAEVIFLHVELALNDEVRKKADKELAQIKHLIMERPPIRPEFVIVQGDPKKKIIELAEKNKVSVVVIGESSGREESISEYVQHNAISAVISVKSKTT